MTDFSVSITPRFYETDALGHINNIAITAWFEVARVRFMEAIDATEKTAEKGWVLAHIAMDYVDETFYGTDVDVAITRAEVGNSSLTMHCEMRQDERLTVKGSAVLVRLDLDSKTKQRVPDSMREAIAGL